MEIPTIKVIYISQPDNGLVDINETDYDPALHALPDAVKPKKRGRPSKKSTEATNGNG